MPAASATSRDCITLHQPYASLVAAGRKRVLEFIARWAVPQNGELFIHASSSLLWIDRMMKDRTARMVKLKKDTLEAFEWGDSHLPEFPLGAVIGRCSVQHEPFQLDEDNLDHDFPFYTDRKTERKWDRWAVILEDAAMFKDIYPIPGQKNIWPWESPVDWKDKLEAYTGRRDNEKLAHLIDMERVIRPKVD